MNRRWSSLQRSSRRRAALLLGFVALLWSTSTVSAWYSGWYTPNFSGTYSPSAYSHGQWDQVWNGRQVEAFGSSMQWNQQRADGVRAYSRNARWISWCGWCPAYYTHDHTDRNHLLHAYGASSNMPNVHLDGDDDNGDGRTDELEVVVLDTNFPTVNATYMYHSYFERARTGAGRVSETPAVSARNQGNGEYDTLHFDSEQSLDYNTVGWTPEPPTGVTGTSSPNTEEAAVNLRVIDNSERQRYNERPIQGSEPFSITLATELFPIVVEGVSGAPFLEVSTLASLGSADELARYAEWTRTVPAHLREAGVQQALTVITFQRPTDFASVEALLGQTNVDMVKAIYVDTRNPDPATNVWTIQSEVWPGTAYTDALAEIVADVAVQTPGQPQLMPQGIVAITAWLPVDTVIELASNELVYLADASPSYLRLLAADTDVVAARLPYTDARRPDGLPNFIKPDVSDVYPQMRLFGVGQ